MKRYVYIWLPAALLIYLTVMIVMFKDDLILSGNQTRLYVTAGIEIAIIIALFFFLKKKTEMRLRREREDRELEGKKKKG